MKAGGVGATMDLLAMLIIVGQGEIRFRQEISRGGVSAAFTLHGKRLPLPVHGSTKTSSGNFI
jgi:hypothetical protein